MLSSISRSTERRDAQLRSQYLINLLVTLDNVRADRKAVLAGTAEHAQAALDLAECETIAELLSVENWQSVYRAEQKLAAFLTETQLDAEWTRRICEAERLKLPSVEKLKTLWPTAEAPPAPPGGPLPPPPASGSSIERKRSAYVTLLDDIHWLYMKRRLDRDERRASANKIAICAASVLFTLVILLGWLYSRGRASRELGDVYLAQAHVAILVSFIAGLSGSLFSRINAFQSTSGALGYDQINSTYSLPYVFVRAVFGAFGAAVLIFLFSSRLLEGAMFPDMSALGFATGGSVSGQPSAELAKLVVWSFIAGFSERFITSALEQTEGRAGK